MAMAKCERTGRAIPLSEGFLVCDVESGEWRFVALGAPERLGEYHFALAEFIKSPEAFVDWMAHLQQKSWFRSNLFFDFWRRLRDQNQLFDYLGRR